MKKLLSIMLAIVMLISLSLSAIADKADYTITVETTAPAPSDWARESVDTANDLGITDKKQYMYQEPITREEFCELIYNYINVLGIDVEDASEDFADTDNKCVAVLYTMGIINGKTETEFAPNDFLTREEAAVILNRMVNRTIPVPVTEMYFRFDDEEQIASWAMESVQIMCNMGVMSGVGDNKFAPKDEYTTEQAIVTIVRISEVQLPDSDIVGGADTHNEIVVTETIEIDDFYIDEAIKLAQESGKLAGDKDFISYYTANEDMAEKILSLGAVDWSKPTEIYYLASDREKIVENINALLGKEAEGFDIEKLLELNKVNFTQIAAMINASYGTETLAALTILTNSEGYIMPENFKKDFALFLKYEGEYSAIVSFSRYGEGVISANMSFVKNGDKDNMFSRIYEIIQVLGEGSIEIALVE